MRVNQNQPTTLGSGVSVSEEVVAACINPAISDAVAKMREEEERLRGEVARLSAQLGAVARARVALERGNRAQAGEGAGAYSAQSARVRLRAPWRWLPKSIVAVVAAASAPLSRGEIIEALRSGGYEFTLAPAAVTRELVALVKARKLKRVGADNAARYLAPRGAAKAKGS